MKKLFIVIILLAAASAAFYWRNDIRDLAFELNKRQLPAEIKHADAPESKDSQASTQGINLAVPWSPQAPFGDWSLPYQEACEETAALLVDRFYRDEELTPDIAKQEIQKIVDWENKTFGYYEHTTAQETARLLQEYFGYNRVDVKYDISIEDIKTQIRAGRPVIVPLAGRLLQNPYYNQPGPIYHMLVIKGLTPDGDFITNDVGTKRGHNYVYPASLLHGAIHDAPAQGGRLSNEELEEFVLAGRAAMIVVYPN